jgi:hypothetical protein
MGADEDGRRFSHGRSSSGVCNPGLACYERGRAGAIDRWIFLHQRPRAPNPVAGDVSTQEKLLAECHRISGVLLD